MKVNARFDNYEVVGFAILVRDEYGQSMVIHSTDVEKAGVTIRQPELFVSDADAEQIATYDVTLHGEHLSIRLDTAPLEGILELDERKRLTVT